MELSWSNYEVPLTQFLEHFKPPQIVKIADGNYGEDDETTLSQGQELNLHMLKELQFFSGLTDSDEKEILIPLTSLHKVKVLSEEKFDVNGIEKLGELFPKRYKHVRLLQNHRNAPNPTLEAGALLETVYFDRDSRRLICLDRSGCEISLEAHTFTAIASGIIPKKQKQKEKDKDATDGVFIAEVLHRCSLPVAVQFVQKSSSEKLQRGLIDLRSVVVEHTVIATTRDTECKTILTFPSTLDVTVVAPEEAVGMNPAYRELCIRANREVNLKRVEETVEKYEELYDDVRNSGIKAIPYAESFFGTLAKPTQENNTSHVPPVKTLTRDTVGYLDMKGTITAKQRNTDLKASSKARKSVYDSDNYIKIDYDSTDSDGYEVPVDGVFTKSEAWKNHTKLAGRSLKTKVGRTSPEAKKEKRFITRLTKKKAKKSLSDGTLVSKSTPSPAFHDELKSSNSGPCKTNEEDIYGCHDEQIYGSRGNDEDIYEYPNVKGSCGERRNSDGKAAYVIPAYRKIEALTVQEVGMLLHDLKLGQYDGIFEREQVDGKILVDLDKECLQSHFNMTSFHAHKLLKATMENWRPTVSD